MVPCTIGCCTRCDYRIFRFFVQPLDCICAEIKVLVCDVSQHQDVASGFAHKGFTQKANSQQGLTSKLLTSCWLGTEIFVFFYQAFNVFVLQLPGILVRCHHHVTWWRHPCVLVMLMCAGNMLQDLNGNNVRPKCCGTFFSCRMPTKDLRTFCRYDGP